MDLKETLGRKMGAVLSGPAYIASTLRHARLFHPEGELYRSEVKLLASEEPYSSLARQLTGEALLRFSLGLSKKQDVKYDILGCAIRFGWDSTDPEKQDEIQDLLFGTFKSPLTLPFAPITTDTSDFLCNYYYTVTPFRFATIDRLEFRLAPEFSNTASEGSRTERLLRAIEKNRAIFALEAKKSGILQSWRPIALIRIRERLDIDDTKILFSPFHSGKGIQATGFINYLRELTYPASYAGRKQ